jgi:diguanylate cyclase (GGDEF)-like protein/PAS domain S-box-containing protein
MAQGPDIALRLMIIDDSVEDAESIVSTLRNAGIAVRPLRPASADELAGMIAGQSIDLVLASQQSTAIPLEEVLNQVKGSGKDLPVVAVADRIDEASLSQALGLGVRAIALRHKPQQLLGATRNEWSDLEARRSLRRLEAQVRETERRCDALIESSREPIAYVHEGMHIRANAAYLEMFGYESFDEIEGMSLLDLIAPQHVDGFKQLLKSLSKGEPPPPRYELQARDLDGNSFPAVMEFTQALYESEPCVQVVFRRQEMDPELAREVEELRQRDQITGLLNRQTFLRSLEDAVSDAAENQSQHGLLLLEPDHYQRLLQEIGLDSADALLAAIAERLRDVLDGALADGSAVAARFSEHSIAVLVRGDHVASTTMAEKLCGAFGAQLFEVGDRSATITLSIGGVQIGEKIASVTQVLAKASQGVQSSIGVGGNRFEIFDPSAIDRAEEERIHAWVARVRDALANDRFLLHYQPVISLQGEPGAMYEAYLRLDAGSGETVPPLQFLQIAEEHGLLSEIDRWVLRRAIAVVAERQRAGQPTTLLIKITQASLVDPDFARYLGDELKANGINGEHLVLQVPEAKVFTNLRAAQEFVAAVSRHGCRVGLEQFGVGLDSFQLLSHFDPAFLKLDRSFMEDLPKNAANQQRVKEIAGKARSLGIRSIAEFVQDAASMTILFSSGVDFVEGYFLAPAGPTMDYDFDS